MDTHAAYSPPTSPKAGRKSSAKALAPAKGKNSAKSAKTSAKASVSKRTSSPKRRASSPGRATPKRPSSPKRRASSPGRATSERPSPGPATPKRPSSPRRASSPGPATPKRASSPRRASSPAKSPARHPYRFKPRNELSLEDRAAEEYPSTPEGKYCSCLISVAAKGQKSPYGICGASTHGTNRRCGANFDFDSFTDEDLAGYARMNGIDPDQSRSALLGEIRRMKVEKYGG